MGAAVGCVKDAMDEARDALVVLRNAGAEEWAAVPRQEVATLTAVRCVLSGLLGGGWVAAPPSGSLRREV